jgi:hypothetical protein
MALFARKKTSIDLSRKNTPLLTVVGKSGMKFAGLIVMLFSLLLAYHYYREASDLRTASLVTTIKGTSNDPVTDVILSVEKHMLLPQGEHPQVAKVSDLSALANIPFFGNALVGDQVLVYCKTSLSILYSPSRDKVIEVSRQPVAGSCPAK